MTSTDDVDSFAAMFQGAESRAEARHARMQRERRSQLTDKQRRRGAVRTTQINFRCSPEFRKLADGLKEHLGAGVSIADVMEQALELLAERSGYKVSPDDPRSA